MNNAAASDSSASSSSSSSSSDADPPLPSEVEARRSYLKEKRLELMNHILRSLDMVTFLHLTYLYFLDCSTVRFLVRAIIQFMFLTPKSIDIPVPPHQRSPVVALVGSYLFCVLRHLWNDNPAAGELTHGYLHGGMIVDFVGQEGPISKWRLAYVNTLVLLLQLVMLSVTVSKYELKPPPEMTDEEEVLGPRVNAEERGVLSAPPPLQRSDMPRDTHSDDGEELQGAELDRLVSEVTAGEFEVVRLDVLRNVWRPWTFDAPPAMMIARTGGGWRFTISRETREWRDGQV